MLKKITFHFLLVCQVFVFVSCCVKTDEIKEDFSSYDVDKNIALIWNDSYFFFSDYQFDLDSLISTGESNNGYVFLNGSLYFSAVEKKTSGDYSILIYRCDIYGNNVELLFKKDGYNTHPWSVGVEDSIYIKYYKTNAFDASGKIVDSYNVLTNEYKNIERGRDATLPEFVEPNTLNYSAKIKDKKFVISNNETGTDQIVDFQLLSDFKLKATVDKYECTPFRADISQNQILLTYRIINNTSHTYPLLVFEYNYNQNIFKFKSIFFAPDIDSVRFKILK